MHKLIRSISIGSSARLIFSAIRVSFLLALRRLLLILKRSVINFFLVQGQVRRDLVLVNLRLRQASGQLGPADFEAQLQALGAALPTGVAGPTQLRFEDGVLQWPALSLSPEQTTALAQALAARGYQLHSEGRQWRLSPGGQP